jgi:hypothetical protein
MSATSWNHRAKGKGERLGGRGVVGGGCGGLCEDSQASHLVILTTAGLRQWLVWSNSGRTTSRTGVLWEKPASVTFYPPQISSRLVQTRTQASAVRGWHLTAWAMAWHSKHNST